MRAFSGSVELEMPAAQVRDVLLDEKFVDYMVAGLAREAGIRGEIRSRSGSRSPDGTGGSQLTFFVPADQIPSMARRVFGNGAELSLRQGWEPGPHSGIFLGKMEVRSNPDRGGIRSKFEVKDETGREDDGAGAGARCTLSFDGKLKINVPIIGPMSEGPAAAQAGQAAEMLGRMVEKFHKEKR